MLCLCASEALLCLLQSAFCFISIKCPTCVSLHKAIADGHQMHSILNKQNHSLKTTILHIKRQITQYVNFAVHTLAGSMRKETRNEKESAQQDKPLDGSRARCTDIGPETFRTQDTSAPVPNCPQDVSALVPKYPDTSALMMPKCLDTSAPMCYKY